MRILRELADCQGVPVHGFCVMPDHVHLVLSPSSWCDVISLVGQFKNLVQRALWAEGHRGRVWQTGFYDHMLRVEESVQRTVEYVLANPVRGGLVATWREYPYCGSLVYEL